ncbi:hypothetical protein DFQ30_005374, partial [Apophysomyces sp. BC1015]
GRLRCGGGGDCVPGPAGQARFEQAQCPRRRLEGRDLRRARQSRSVQAAVCGEHRRAYAGRCDQGCGRVSRLLECRRAEAGNGPRDGRQAADSRAGQPGAGNPAGGGEE